MASVTPQAEETGPDAPQSVESQSTETTDRPEGLPDNFNSVDDLVKAFKDTQAELTRSKQAKPEEATEDTAPEDKPDDKPAEEEADKSKEDKAAEDVAKAAGVDLTEYSNEFWETGDVPDDRRAELAEKFSDILGGDARSIIDDFVEGKKVLVKNHEDMLFQEAGGKDNYAKMSEWASKSLSKAELTAYNKAVEGSDIHAAQLAIGGMKVKYEKAVGKDPNLVQSDGLGGGSSGYQSKAQMMKDMNSPEYRSDPAFRAKVQQKIKNSKVMG